jgi:hypothetical protein
MAVPRSWSVASIRWSSRVLRGCGRTTKREGAWNFCPAATWKKCMVKPGENGRVVGKNDNWIFKCWRCVDLTVSLNGDELFDLTHLFRNSKFLLVDDDIGLSWPMSWGLSQSMMRNPFLTNQYKGTFVYTFFLTVCYQTWTIRTCDFPWQTWEETRGFCQPQIAKPNQNSDTLLFQLVPPISHVGL